MAFVVFPYITKGAFLINYQSIACHCLSWWDFLPEYFGIDCCLWWVRLFFDGGVMFCVRCLGRYVVFWVVCLVWNLYKWGWRLVVRLREYVLCLLWNLIILLDGEYVWYHVNSYCWRGFQSPIKACCSFDSMWSKNTVASVFLHNSHVEALGLDCLGHFRVLSAYSWRVFLYPCIAAGCILLPFVVLISKRKVTWR